MLVKKFLMKNNKIIKKNNSFISNEIFDNEIIVNFSTVPTNLEISKSTLLYDKDFAYSFTMADGYSSAYTIAFPLLQGVLSGSTYTSGLTYTDGCGNDLNFRFGLSIFSISDADNDLHIDTPNILTWDQIIELTELDWNVFNHGYHGYITGTTYQELYDEMKNGEEYILAKTGYNPIHVVMPNGNPDYIEPALDYGIKSFCITNPRVTWSGVTHKVSNTGVTVDNEIDFNPYWMYEHYNWSPSGTTEIDTTVTDYVDELYNNSNSNVTLWAHENIHSVIEDIPPNNGNMQINTFSYLFNHIYNTYGKKGDDSIWMAPYQEVYEYLYVRDNTNITYEIIGNSVKIKLNQLSSFLDLRKLQLSLNISSDNANIESIELDGYTNFSYNGTGTTSSLVNLDWSNGIILLAEKYVTIAETEKAQLTIDKAQYFVNKIYIPSIKTQYQIRLDNVVIPTTKIYLFDFGQSGFYEQAVVTDTESELYDLKWNNVVGSTTDPINFEATLDGTTLVDTTGLVTTYGFEYVGGFYKMGTDGNNVDGLYPAHTLKDALTVTGTTEGIFKFTNLGIDKIYDFLFCPSRESSTQSYNTIFSVIGDTTYGPVSLQAAENTTLDVTINSVMPNASGEIYINMSTDQTRGYLNALKIIENII